MPNNKCINTKALPTEEGVSFVADEEHYTEVFKRITYSDGSLVIP
jgi:hypothetical protein